MGDDDSNTNTNTNTDGSLLYICTYECKEYEEHKEYHSLYTIHALRLSDLLSKDESDGRGRGGDASKSNYTDINSKLELRKVAYMGDKDFPYDMGCGVLGSKILFAGGLEPSNSKPDKPGYNPDFVAYGPHTSAEIYVFETSSSSSCQHDSNEPMIKKGQPCVGGGFLKGKPHPMLAEVDGKLYALTGNTAALVESPAFEMFDPNVGRWASLPAPPYLSYSRYVPSSEFSYATEGTKIMASTSRSSVFCFDVAAPSPQWRQCSRHPFPFLGRALVLDDAGGGGGNHNNDYKLMFAYITHGQIVAYRLSNNDGRTELVFIKRVLDRLPAGFGGAAAKISFAHLGGPRVCFAISNFRSRYGDEADGTLVREKMRLLVMTFEFSFSGIRDLTSFSSKTLGSHIFEFDWSQESAAETLDAELLGCFVR